MLRRNMAEMTFTDGVDQVCVDSILPVRLSGR